MWKLIVMLVSYVVFIHSSWMHSDFLGKNKHSDHTNTLKASSFRSGCHSMAPNHLYKQKFHFKESVYYLAREEKAVVLLQTYYLRDYEKQTWEEKSLHLKWERLGFHGKYFLIGKDGKCYCGSWLDFRECSHSTFKKYIF